MRVAIIGAGPSGLTAARHVKEFTSDFDIYDRRNGIGGVWRDRVDFDGYSTDENIVAASPIYDNLRTNTPIDAMKVDGLNFESSDGSCFVAWNEVNRSFKAYANKFGLMKHIYLQTEVIKVSRKNDEWKVCSRNLSTGKISEKFYDGVIVCNGHEEIPRKANFEGLSLYQGIKIHSKIYRNPEQFSNKNVLIIGVGPSGRDIAVDLESKAKTVYLSHHVEYLHNSTFAENVIQKPDVKRFTQDSVVFVDNSTEVIDAIILCTGYEYNISFLDESCGVTLGQKYIKNLYKQMICIDHPTLFLTGLQRLFFMFPLAELQGNLAAKILKGDVKLPTKEEMIEDTKLWEQKQRSEGRNEDRFLDLERRGREYMLGLCELGSIIPRHESFFELFSCYFEKYEHEPSTFRKHSYKIDSNNQFIFKRFC